MLRSGGIAGKQQRAKDKGQKAPDHRVKPGYCSNINGNANKAAGLLDVSAAKQHTIQLMTASMLLKPKEKQSERHKRSETELGSYDVATFCNSLSVCFNP